ncbi:DUF1772 domain-containing protein [Nonomuraea africana]|uniref:Transposase n=1 Tax=Nonomuraea africana TaxID=46171 RepID=A0ABR9KB56_9ACTN|nr:DUF1772 domain-containing protein [Nonomuraea africana]MBE1559249.1 transposase [Nonomuraea africana]
MLEVLQVLAVLFFVLGTVPALAHALESPGKRRLDKDVYLAVQSIYHPGFTLAAGIGKAVGLIVLIVLLLSTPAGTVPFWLTLVAVLALVAMQAVYWTVTHPLDRHWMVAELHRRRDEHRHLAYRLLFGDAAATRTGLHVEPVPADWQPVRDRWEYSHVARAALAVVGLVALIIAVSG